MYDFEGVPYAVDIVYCVDLTASMKPTVRNLKNVTRYFQQSLVKSMKINRGHIVTHLRSRVIGFRDFYCNGPYALEDSGFFNLPQENEAFERFEDRLEAKGGGDIPENSLEALALAMQSDWYQPTDPAVRSRQYIILITDAPSHPLERAANYTGKNYPAGMPKDYEELVGMWMAMEPATKRLGLFVPIEGEPWESIEDDFECSAIINMQPGKGGRDAVLKEDNWIDIMKCFMDEEMCF